MIASAGSQARSGGVFMHLNHETRGDLLRRLGSNSRFVRPQVEFAIRVAMNPLFSTTTCRFEVGKFVVHVLAGSGVDPHHLDRVRGGSERCRPGPRHGIGGCTRGIRSAAPGDGRLLARVQCVQPV